MPTCGATPVDERGKPIGASGEVIDGRGRPMGGSGGNGARVDTDDCAAALAGSASTRIAAG